MDVRGRVTTSIEDAKSDLDRALAELQQLQTFDPARVGFVAHALNNYLTVTLITMEMLSRALATHENPEVRTWVDGVQHATHVMKYTVGKLLQVSGSADFPLKLEAVNIVVLMDRACQYFEGVARHKGIDPFDLKPNFSFHDDPPGAGVRMQGARRLRSRTGVDVLAAQVLIIDDDFAPVGFPFVLGLEIG